MPARDLVGYGEFPPNPDWPGGAVIAVNFNLNVEGGGEATLANGDDRSEGMLNDMEKAHGVPKSVELFTPDQSGKYIAANTLNGDAGGGVVLPDSKHLQVLGTYAIIHYDASTAMITEQAKTGDIYTMLEKPA